MKQKNLLTRMLLLFALVVGSVTSAWAQTTVTLWSEDFSSYSADDVPSGGTYSYVCGNGGGTTKIWNENLAGGTAPELLVAKGSGSFSATISDLKGCTGTLTLQFLANQTNLTPSAKVGNTTCEISGTTVKDKNSTYTITLPDNASSVTIVFTQTSSNKNSRLDNIVLTGTKASNPDDQSVATTTTIDASGITNTDVYTSTTAGSLSATVSAGGNSISGATVSWSSSNTGVATIDASGAVTLVAAGTTTITASYAGVSGTYQPSSATYDLNVTSSAPDYVTLPFTWDGGSKAGLQALVGVTGYGLGSDYSSGNAPYLIKFDDTGDYIQIKTDSQPGKVTIGVKMIGGATSSIITVQGSSDGETFTNVENLTISGAENDVLTLVTTNAFAATVRYVRLLFTKGSNIGVGPISIAKPTNDPVINAESTINLAADATSGEISYTISNSVDGTSLTASVEDGCDWISNVTVETAKVTFTATANDGDERSAVITLTYGEVTKNVTVIQAKAPFTITDGVFDFTQDEDYGSDLKQSGVKVQTSTWTAVNVTMVMTGRNCWYDNNPDQIRLYKASGDDAAGSITLSVPDGSVITNIAFTGANLGHMSSEDGYTSSGTTATWEGEENSITFTASDRTDIETITVTYMSMPSSVSLAPAKTYTTLTSAYNLDFTGLSLKAYIVKDDDVSDGKITMTQVNKVPAGTGLVIKAENPGTAVNVPVLSGEADDVTGNKMKGSATATTAIAANEGWILSNGEFHPSNGNGVLAAGKAYLAIPVPTTGAPALSMDFDGETTSISEELRVNSEEFATTPMYDLSGRRVAQPTKGLYIVNGKKVILK